MKKALVGLGALAVLVSLTGFTIDLTIIFGSGADHAFTPLHTYFIAPSGCSDANNGTSTATPWCTPAHNVVCGDVILAETGQYATNNPKGWGGKSGGQSQSLIDFGTVSGCPSTSGGIDGTGGVYFATLLCAGASVGDCKMDINPDGGAGCTSSTCQAFDIEQNNWAVEGWEASSPNSSSVSAAYFFHDCTGVSVIHHAAFINDIANNSGAGFSYGSCTGGAPGPDYMASVGNIAQKTNTNGPSFCGGSINIVVPQNFDTVAGTHVYFYNNFVWNGTGNGCAFDQEGMNIDTLDGNSYSSQLVVANNIFYTNAADGIHYTYQGGATSIHTPIKIYNNTLYDNNTTGWSGVTGSFAGEIANFSGTDVPWAISITNNISLTGRATNASADVFAAFIPGSTTITVGGTGSENVFKGLLTTCDFTCDSGNNISYQFPASILANFFVDPTFANTTDLTSNRNGTPNCSGFTNVTACMGYNAATKTLTTLSTIGDLQASCGNCSGKGFQLPSTTCAANSDYPTWLKGVVYLRASGWVNGATITEVGDLVTKPCGM